MSTDQMQQELRIYKGYRAALKGITASARTADSRAGGRKQKAREITAERYKVPISTVKAIVREHEVEEGVVHEPTANLVERRRIEALYAEELDRVRISNPERNCSHCGGKATDKIELKSGGTMERGEARLRFEPIHYRETGEPLFLDVCLPCWVLEFGHSGASYRDQEPMPLVWAARTV